MKIGIITFNSAHNYGAVLQVWALQEKLKREAINLNNEYNMLKNSVEQYINGIRCDEYSVLYGSFCDAKEGKLPIEEIVSLTEKLILEDTNEENSITLKKGEIQKELDKVKALILKAEDYKKAKNDLINNEEAILKAVELQKELSIKLEFEKINLSEAKKLTDKSAEIKALLPDYDELSIKTGAYEDNKKFLDEGDSLILKSEEAIALIKDETAKLNEELKGLEKIGEEKIKLENNKESLKAEKDKLEALEISIKGLEGLSAEVNGAIASYNDKYADFEKLDAEYKEQTRLYFEAQAGILADTLEADKPCPVCGSVNHPKKAKKPESVLTKDELDAMQKTLSEANEKVNSARDEAGRLKGVLLEKEESIKKEINSVLGDVIKEDAKTVILVRLSEINSLIEKANEAIKEAELKISRKEKIEKILPEKNNEYDFKCEKLLEIKDTLKVRAAENEALKKRISELKDKLAFDSKKQAEDEIAVMEATVKNAEEKYTGILDAVNSGNEKLASLKSAKEEIIKRIGTECDVDIEGEREVKGSLEEQLNSLDETGTDIHSRIDSNKLSLININKRVEEIKRVEEKLTWVRALSNTANGNLSGKEKIMLETYIQMTYFDRIINRANKRLLVMSGGQYELKRRKAAENNRSQSGLELDVHDYYNGTERSVKTLSGGESFKASLSLALGLSDEIQSSAGGVKLDTMFVDEGFGSLDEESLAHAINALNSLAEGNRLVGIISHVSELKEKIDKQIVVKKEQTGGSKVTIIS